MKSLSSRTQTFMAVWIGSIIFLLIISGMIYTSMNSVTPAPSVSTMILPMIIITTIGYLQVFRVLTTYYVSYDSTGLMIKKPFMTPEKVEFSEVISIQQNLFMKTYTIVTKSKKIRYFSNKSLMKEFESELSIPVKLTL